MNPQETISQLGAGLNSAIVYCGGRNIKFSSKTDTLYISVNGRRGYATTMFIKLEANDTYTVRLLSMNPRRPLSSTTASDERKDVYCDELKQVFEDMYDNHMNAFNKGFIPLG